MADQPELPDDERAWAREMLGKRFRDRAVYAAAQRLLAREEVDAQGCAECVRLLSDVTQSRWHERWVAAWTLGYVHEPPTEARTAAAMLCRALRSRTGDDPFARGCKRTAIGGAVFAALSVVSTVVLGLTMVRPGLEQIMSILIGALIAALIAFISGSFLSAFVVMPISLGIEKSRNDRLRVLSARGLQRLGNPLSVGALAEGALDYNEDVAQAARKALYVILPQLTEEHYGIVRQDTLERLCTLSNQYPESLAVASVRALGQVGGGSCVETVERLARSGWRQKVKDAAQEALEPLRRRSAREREAAMLLRASDAPRRAPEEELLRPAGFESGDPEMLLRPAVEAATLHLGGMADTGQE